MIGLNERNQNSAAFRTTGTRAAVDCWNFHLCVGGFGYRCNRPLDPGVLRKYSKRGRTAQTWSGAGRIREWARRQPAAPHRSTGSDQPPKPGAVPRMRRRRIDAENRASRHVGGQYTADIRVARGLTGGASGSAIAAHAITGNGYAITVRFRDGSTTVLNEASPRTLPLGSRVMVIGRSMASSN
jgi:hypothetical protein